MNELALMVFLCLKRCLMYACAHIADAEEGGRNSDIVTGTSLARESKKLEGAETRT